MAGPTYISNPSLWEQFKHVDSGENFIPMIPRKSQRGGGIFFKKKAYMVPVKPSMPKPPNIQQVTPVAADEERAASDLKEVMRNDEPHMPLKNRIKRRRKASSIRNRSSVKGKGRFQKKKQRGRKQLKSLRKALKKKSIPSKKRQVKKKSSKKRKTVKKPSKKRKSIVDSSNTIF
ncbi:hypothetical protein FSP39_021161 [Pinctada imbricata]|uniref:Uncharacterized protein n=1 Tax=Pinctada imbricata TaxID=66713 RepID=A0AA88YUE0_PINIB|nr:hypothetical protein FSP39_021161 [Pinctada imbricata]